MRIFHVFFCSLPKIFFRSIFRHLRQNQKKSIRSANRPEFSPCFKNTVQILTCFEGSQNIFPPVYPPLYDPSMAGKAEGWVIKGGGTFLPRVGLFTCYVPLGPPAGFNRKITKSIVVVVERRGWLSLDPLRYAGEGGYRWVRTGGWVQWWGRHAGGSSRIDPSQLAAFCSSTQPTASARPLPGSTKCHRAHWRSHQGFCGWPPPRGEILRTAHKLINNVPLDLGKAMPRIPFAMAVVSWVFIRRYLGNDRYYDGYCKKIDPIALMPETPRTCLPPLSSVIWK